MELFYVVSFLTQEQKSTVADIISDKILGKTSDVEDQDDSTDTSIMDSPKEGNNHAEVNVKDVEKIPDENIEHTKQGGDIEKERSKDNDGDNKKTEQSLTETLEEDVTKESESAENLIEEEN